MSSYADTQGSRADRLIAAVRNLPFSAKEIARRIGYSYRTVEKWQAGDSRPSLEAGLALAREFDPIWEVMKDAAGRANSISEAEAILSEFTARLIERRNNAE